MAHRHLDGELALDQTLAWVENEVRRAENKGYRDELDNTYAKLLRARFYLQHGAPRHPFWEIPVRLATLAIAGGITVGGLLFAERIGPSEPHLATSLLALGALWAGLNIALWLNMSLDAKLGMAISKLPRDRFLSAITAASLPMVYLYCKSRGLDTYVGQCPRNPVWRRGNDTPGPGNPFTFAPLEPPMSNIDSNSDA